MRLCAQLRKLSLKKEHLCCLLSMLVAKRMTMIRSMSVEGSLVKTQARRSSRTRQTKQGEMKTSSWLCCRRWGNVRNLRLNWIGPWWRISYRRQAGNSTTTLESSRMLSLTKGTGLTFSSKTVWWLKYRLTRSRRTVIVTTVWFWSIEKVVVTLSYLRWMWIKM